MEDTMWDESLIESGKRPQGRKKWITAPLSILVHGAIVGLLVLGSYWFVEAVQPVIPPAPVLIPVALPGGGDHTRPAHRQNPPKHPVRETQPQNVAPLDEVIKDDTPPVRQESTDGEYIPGTEGFGNGSGDGQGLLPGTGSGDGIGGPDPGYEPAVPYVVEMTQPQLIHRVDPEYPKIARTIHLQGIVVLRAVIARDGTVEQVQLLRSVHPLLDQAAMKAVEHWLYRPATLHGKPVKVYFTVTVRFILK
jgi:TonB family protein